MCLMKSVSVKILGALDAPQTHWFIPENLLSHLCLTQFIIRDQSATTPHYLP